MGENPQNYMWILRHVDTDKIAKNLKGSNFYIHFITHFHGKCNFSHFHGKCNLSHNILFEE